MSAVRERQRATETAKQRAIERGGSVIPVADDIQTTARARAWNTAAAIVCLAVAMWAGYTKIRRYRDAR
jgi:hypothetical protein